VKLRVCSWLLPTAIAVLLLSSPANAARLESWRFDANENRLYFTTQGGVQPKAQLIANPTRLTIDLPGTTLGRPLQEQAIAKPGFDSIRVGQFESNITRLVIELKPGYTLNPQAVRFHGNSTSEWVVELPDPEPIANGSDGGLNARNSDRRAIGAPSNPGEGGAGLVENIQVTPDGLFIRTRGNVAAVEVQHSRDRAQVYIDVRGATISTQLRSRQQMVARHGVKRFTLSETNNSPPVTRLTLELENPDAQWVASASNLGGIVLLPQDPRATIARGSSSSPPSVPSDRPVTIRSIDLENSGSQLSIRSDGPFTYSSGWDRSTGVYQITIPGAQLASGADSAQRFPNNSLLWVRLKQADPQTVQILVQPAAGVRIGTLTQSNPETLSLALERSSTTLNPPNRNLANAPSNRPFPAPTAQNRRERLVVVVDPGHGGRDPGAVGIGGLQEKNIVLPISQQVVSILEQNGVQAVITRRDDREIDLPPRVQLANRVNADIFVSIHANAIDMSRPDVNGIETYYYASGDRLARTIHNSILQTTRAGDRGVRQARFYVLRHTAMPAVLVEVGFVTGARDAPRLADPAYQQQMASAIARGILQYLQQNR